MLHDEQDEVVESGVEPKFVTTQAMVTRSKVVKALGATKRDIVYVIMELNY